MGNCQLQDCWDRIKTCEPSPDSPCPVDLTFTSTETYTEYRVTRILNEEKGYYEAQDSSGSLYRLKCMQIDDFDLVKTLHKRLNLLKLHQKVLHSAVILDVIEEPPVLSSSWVLAILLKAEDSLGLDALLTGWQLEEGNNGEKRGFALEDVMKGLGKVLGSVEVLHQLGLTVGPIGLDCVEVVRRASGKFKVRVDFLQCLEVAFGASKAEGRSKEADLRDIGMALLSALLSQPIPTHPTMDFLLSIPYPSLLKLYLIRLLKPISRLTDPSPILTCDSFLLLQQLLRKQEIQTVRPPEALVLVLALEFRTMELRVRALKLLLQLLARCPVLREDAVMREISPLDVGSILDMVDLEADSDLIAPAFELLQSIIEAKGQLACKQAGIIRFFRRCLRTFPSFDRRFQGYLPALLSFCSAFDCGSCFYLLALQVFPSMSTANPSTDLKQYVLKTCHRYGDLSPSIITSLLEQRLVAGPVDCLGLLFQVPSHLYRPISVEVAKVLIVLLGVHDDVKVRFELVTEFLSYALQQTYIWSHFALKGLCFTLESGAFPGSTRPCAHGYQCRSCNVQLCSTCVAFHFPHSVTYLGSVQKCQGTPIGPLFPQLLYHPATPTLFLNSESKHPIVSDCLRGPGVFETAFLAQDGKNGPESLDFYLELQIRTGGDTDNVTVSIGTAVSYSSQDGLIRVRSEKAVPGPPLSACDVVGVGFTSHSRAVFTFNGVAHAYRIYCPEVIGRENKVTIALEADCEVMILPLKQHLFQPGLSLQPSQLLLAHSSKVRLPREFWSLYKAALKKVKRMHKPSACRETAELFLKSKDPQDQEPMHSHSCQCLLS